jgi:hypothetical protein
MIIPSVDLSYPKRAVPGVGLLTDLGARGQG